MAVFPETAYCNSGTSISRFSKGPGILVGYFGASLYGCPYVLLNVDSKTMFYNFVNEFAIFYSVDKVISKFLCPSGMRIFG